MSYNAVISALQYISSIPRARSIVTTAASALTTAIGLKFIFFMCIWAGAAHKKLNRAALNYS
jgi:hypothetical protein